MRGSRASRWVVVSSVSAAFAAAVAACAAPAIGSGKEGGTSSKNAAASVDVAGWSSVTEVPEQTATAQVDCSAAGHRVSPLIFGIGYYPLSDAKDGYVWEMRPAARRWGGNHTSRYNWRLGNAWNTGADWFFRNVNYTGDPAFSWRDFLRAERRHGVGTALVMPMLGWVSKDTSSVAFPVSVFGPQHAVDPYKGEAGDGLSEGGRELVTSPERTSVRSTPADVEEWVREIRKLDKELGGRSVQLYLLDNEPELWNSTHRDVHPEPVSYDELLERTIAYASAIRRADPGATIGGPSAWGWPAYFYSAVDVKAGFFVKPDRRAHGDVPLLSWYLRELNAFEKRTGVRLLDVLDVHYYPQELARDSWDEETQGRRLRATRSLWDKSYKDESWIADVVQLLPRLSRLVAENYPGLRLSIGEYNFGAEGHASGALALAEVLGRFAEAPELFAAFYWTYPPKDSPAYQAFRAYRNYDGHGGRFLDVALPAQAAAPMSLFASRDEGKKVLVAVALNLDTRASKRARIALHACGRIGAIRAFRYAAGDAALDAVASPAVEGDALVASLPPLSINLFEVAINASAAPPRGRSESSRSAPPSATE
jgi:hypothetical protein